MNLKILGILIIYYLLCGLIILAISLVVGTTASQNMTGVFNGTGIQPPETDTGGLFSSGISFGRFFSLLFVGIGLPDDTPTIFMAVFAIFQSAVTFFTIALIIDAIWSG